MHASSEFVIPRSTLGFWLLVISSSPHCSTDHTFTANNTLLLVSQSILPSRPTSRLRAGGNFLFVDGFGDGDNPRAPGRQHAGTCHHLPADTPTQQTQQILMAFQICMTLKRSLVRWTACSHDSMGAVTRTQSSSTDSDGERQRTRPIGRCVKTCFCPAHVCAACRQGPWA